MSRPQRLTTRIDNALGNIIGAICGLCVLAYAMLLVGRPILSMLFGVGLD